MKTAQRSETSPRGRFEFWGKKGFPNSVGFLIWGKIVIWRKKENENNEGIGGGKRKRKALLNENEKRKTKKGKS